MENSAEVPAGQRAGRHGKGKPRKDIVKHRGDLAEMGFMFKAAGLGFGVAKPWGNNERYDFVLEFGQKFWRVQVKSTYVPRKHRYLIVAKGQTSGKSQAYTARQIDFLVAYIVAEDAWYVIPIAAFAPRMQLNFYPSGRKIKDGGRYEKYREAWDLMKADPEQQNLDRSRALGEECRRERPARAAARRAT